MCLGFSFLTVVKLILCFYIDLLSAVNHNILVYFVQKGMLKEDKVGSQDVRAMMALTVAKLVNSYCYLGSEQCNDQV